MTLDLIVFAAAAAVVWAAGTRLTRLAEAISQRTGIGQAMIGLLLLGGITSLPEVATSLTAGIRGNAELAVNNVLGGVALQVVVLAIADAVIGRDALSSIVARPNVLLLGTLDVLLLSIVIAGVAVGDVAILGVGAWSIAIALFYLVAIWRMTRFRGRLSWMPHQRDAANRNGERTDDNAAALPDLPNGALALQTAFAALVIFAAGYILTTRGESIADHSGLGDSFVGAVLVSLATSLPEISTATTAVRLRRYDMAFADIFGTNLFDLALIFLIDAVFTGPPVLDVVGTFSLFAAVLGIALTTVFLVGLIERGDRVVLRMGVDSLAVIVLYAAGLIVLFQLRSS